MEMLYLFLDLAEGGMQGVGGARIECVCTFPPLTGLNPCQPGDGCTAEPVYLITRIIN